MKIYGSFTSPFVRHCRIVLLTTNLKCDFVEIDAQQSAELSPTKKVPLLIDGALTLTDSSSILKYLREKAGFSYLAEIKDFELFNMTNTVMDASVNIFFLEKMDNIGLNDSKYLQRQNNRVLSGLQELNNAVSVDKLPLTDGEIRLACFLDWGLYRKRIDLSELGNLQCLLELARTDEVFTQTAPPA
ncbi:glutathione S-transferase N-terminal domain-containing protein [Psychromonas ossibalaenae]|uniref:glutathione S-transferase N-terminal domain-containing protein n=1 Tax=Psychromonas ossibalaenae TaxID=444922 RepID=UPI00036FF891|nr:glutathione S-transferase N-terminal domain-containing protein [Psychromonas ossibalaenae]